METQTNIFLCIRQMHEVRKLHRCADKEKKKVLSKETRCLQLLPITKNVKSLLSLIASYSNFKISSPCKILLWRKNQKLDIMFKGCSMLELLHFQRPNKNFPIIIPRESVMKSHNIKRTFVRLSMLTHKHDDPFMCYNIHISLVCACAYSMFVACYCNVRERNRRQNKKKPILFSFKY